MFRHRKEATYIMAAVVSAACLAWYAWESTNVVTATATKENNISDDPLIALLGLFAGLAMMKLYHMFLLVISLVSAACGMEYYARYFHRESWHNEKSFSYKVHQSHHKDKSVQDAFEANDALGVMNFFVVIGPLIWSSQAMPPTCGSVALFGLCCGISVFGTSYMFVHDGLHHRRFPVWGIDRIPWIRRVADAHKYHHMSDQGPPFGLFLGPQEVEAHRTGVPPAPIPWYLKATLVVCSSIAITGLLLGY